MLPSYSHRIFTVTIEAGQSQSDAFQSNTWVPVALCIPSGITVASSGPQNVLGLVTFQTNVKEAGAAYLSISDSDSGDESGVVIPTFANANGCVIGYNSRRLPLEAMRWGTFSKLTIGPSAAGVAQPGKTLLYLLCKELVLV